MDSPGPVSDLAGTVVAALSAMLPGLVSKAVADHLANPLATVDTPPPGGASQAQEYDQDRVVREALSNCALPVKALCLPEDRLVSHFLYPGHHRRAQTFFGV